ncbi:MAG: RNA polymerase sigma factor RpoD/SigA [Candidatus Andersenbacteria bacterium]|nr:RNA polymerase sigma factor RpoD/SigA [bacterium]MDZ4225389.1 RNA polymerase sigma factor RpoD/SigA [Candidatus Andersenbacteria bacterium]
MAVKIQKKKRGTILSQYLGEVGETALLTAEEEQALARKIQKNHDEDARQRMMKANLRLVVSIAKKYAPSNDPEMLMDLIQEGNIGLMKAVSRFQPDRKTRFSTYGVYWIKQAILRALKSRRIVRLPENVVDQVLAMQRTRQSLYQLLGREPSVEEVASEMKIALKEARRLEEVSAEVVSLDYAVRGGDDNEETQLRELLEDVEAPQPDQVARRELVRSAVRSAVTTLPQREKKILEMRFGLADNQSQTLEEIGRYFGISRERVRQLQNLALYRLRRRQAMQRVYR